MADTAAMDDEADISLEAYSPKLEEDVEDVLELDIPGEEKVGRLWQEG